MNEHTPIPWATEDGWVYGNPLDGQGGESCAIAQIHSGPDCAQGEHWHSNRRLIVAAVNSYGKHCADAVECAEADLLGESFAALRAMLDAIGPLPTKINVDPKRAKAWRLAGAVLAKAEDKP